VAWAWTRGAGTGDVDPEMGEWPYTCWLCNDFEALIQGTHDTYDILPACLFVLFPLEIHFGPVHILVRDPCD